MCRFSVSGKSLYHANGATVSTLHPQAFRCCSLVRCHMHFLRRSVGVEGDCAASMLAIINLHYGCRQGDVEVANGLPVSPLMDRNKPGPLKGGNQVGFFKFIVKPMVDTWVEMFPSSKPLQDNLNSNYLFWEHNFDSCPEVPDTPFLHAGKSVSALHSTSTKSFHRLVGNGIQQQEMVPISLPV